MFSGQFSSCPWEGNFLWGNCLVGVGGGCNYPGSNHLGCNYLWVNFSGTWKLFVCFVDNNILV